MAKRFRTCHLAIPSRHRLVIGPDTGKTPTPSPPCQMGRGQFLDTLVNQDIGTPVFFVCRAALSVEIVCNQAGPAVAETSSSHASASKELVKSGHIRVPIDHKAPLPRRTSYGQPRTGIEGSTR